MINHISYVSLCSSAIQRKKGNSLHSLPAIELKLFGVDKHYQHETMSYGDKQVKFSEFTFMWVLAFINNVLKEYIGVEYLILFSVPQKNTLKFYEKMGMSYLTDAERVYDSDFSDGCVPMYLELLKWFNFLPYGNFLYGFVKIRKFLKFKQYLENKRFRKSLKIQIRFRKLPYQH